MNPISNLIGQAIKSRRCGAPMPPWVRVDVMFISTTELLLSSPAGHDEFKPPAEESRHTTTPRTSVCFLFRGPTWLGDCI